MTIARQLCFNPREISIGFELDATEADLIVLADDIDNGLDGLKWSIVESLTEGKPLIYVVGNNELYGHTRRPTHKAIYN